MLATQHCEQSSFSGLYYDFQFPVQVQKIDRGSLACCSELMCPSVFRLLCFLGGRDAVVRRDERTDEQRENALSTGIRAQVRSTPEDVTQRGGHPAFQSSMHR